MNRITMLTLTVGFMILMQASPASATITNIVGGDTCVNPKCPGNATYPVRQGQTTTITVEGQFVDLSTRLEITGAGVTVANAGTSSGKKSIRITVADNAALGLRTIRLRYLVETSGPDTFNIRVLRSGRVTGVTVPTPNVFFNQADVRLTGTNIGNAAVFILSSNPTATAELVSNSNTEAVVRLRYTGNPLAEASTTIALCDAQLGGPMCVTNSKFRYAGIANFGQNPVRILGPNAVSSITFPLGNSVRQGSVFSIRVTLVRPVEQANGQVVRWQIVPSNSFEAAPGSGTQFSPTGDNPSGENSVTIPVGNQSIILSVRLRQVPAGCSGAGCTGEVRTRSGNFTIDQAPFLRVATFTMVPDR